MALWLLFGLASAAFIQLVGMAQTRTAALDRLLLGLSGGALLTAAVWIAMLGIRRSKGWRWAMLGGMWIPYVNFVIAGLYVRRYWSEDGRGPGWLALGGLAVQALASVRMLLAAPPPPV